MRFLGSSLARLGRGRFTRRDGTDQFERSIELLEDRCLLSAVNVAPSFTAGPNITVNEDAGPQRFIGWAGGISPGAVGEVTQTLTFGIISDSNPGLFDSAPTIGGDGTLRFTTKPNAFGVANVSVRLHDDGGTANGGADTSPPQSFSITVNSVDDAPVGVTDLYFVRKNTPITVAVTQDNTMVQFAGGNTLTSADAKFTANGSSNHVNIEIQGSGSNRYSFSFASPQGQPLGVGSYPDAARYPFEAPYQAGLDITRYSSGNNQSHGSFIIYQLAFGPDNQLAHFAADFANTGDTVSLSGTIEYNGSSPSGVLKNDTDADYGSTLSASLISGVSHGQLVFNPDGTFTYTPSAGFVGTDQFTYRPNDGTLNGTETAVQLVVRLINDPPEFTAGPDVSVFQDAGSQVIANWATGISPGSPEESGQTLTFNTVANDNPALFTQQPTVDPLTGSLRFAAGQNASGTATVSIGLSDNGGTVGGGVDTSSVHTFRITIIPPNKAPRFTHGSNIVIGENAGPQTIDKWAMGISPGAPDEINQHLVFNIVDNDNSNLFTQQPTVDPLTGALRFVPAFDTVGKASISLTLSDDGGTVRGGVDTSAVQTFTISVLHINNAPDFTVGPDVSVDEDASSQIFANWATGISPGAPEEAGQTLTFDVTNDQPSLFSAQPMIDPVTGTLTFAGVANAFGSADVSVTLCDNGGTVVGGIDTSSVRTFIISFRPVNDAPIAVSDHYRLVQDQIFHAPGDRTTSLMLDSRPGDYIGQGMQHTWTTADGSFSAGATYPSRDVASSVQFCFIGGDESWTLDFDVPGILTAGTTYTGATRFPFNAGVGLDIRGDGRGSNQLTGQFTIRHIEVQGGTVISFAADFEQHCEGAGPALLGSIYYNYSPVQGVLANDSDVESDTLTASLSSGPQHGELNLNPDGTFAYTPDTGFVGTDSFVYQTSDGVTQSQPATVTLNVVTTDTLMDPTSSSGANLAPKFTPGPDIVISESAAPTTRVGWATGISAGLPDEVDQTLTFNVVANDNPDLFSQQPAIDPATGTLTFATVTGVCGTANISVTLSDNGGTALGGIDTSILQTFAITVRPENHAPTAATDTYTLLQDRTFRAPSGLTTFLVFNSQAGDYVGGGIKSIWTSQNGTFSARKPYDISDAAASVQIDFESGDEWWTLNFEAPEGQTLNVGQTYTNATRFPFNAEGAGLDVSGDGRGSNELTGQFTIRHIEVDGDTIDSFAADFEQHSDGAKPALFGRIYYNFAADQGVLANDTDADGDALIATGVSGPAHGTLELNSDGTFSYTPRAGFIGTDSFVYQSSDGTDPSQPVTVTLNVVKTGTPVGPAAGLGVSTPCTIRGNVYNDVKTEGSWQNGEKGVAKQLVYLDLNEDGKLNTSEPRVRTNSSGNFTFGKIDPGDYTIRVVAPSGWRTSIGQSAQAVSLSAGQTSSVIRLGLTQRSALVGTVFTDANHNGKWDYDETTPTGASLFVDINGNGRLDSGESSTVPNNQGVFTLKSLPAGSYTLCLHPQKGAVVKLRQVKLAATKITSVPVFGVKPI